MPDYKYIFSEEFGRPGNLYSQGLKLHLTKDFSESAHAFVEKWQPVFHGR